MNTNFKQFMMSFGTSFGLVMGLGYIVWGEVQETSEKVQRQEVVIGKMETHLENIYEALKEIKQEIKKK